MIHGVHFSIIVSDMLAVNCRRTKWLEEVGKERSLSRFRNVSFRQQNHGPGLHPQPLQLDANPSEKLQVRSCALQGQADEVLGQSITMIEAIAGCSDEGAHFMYCSRERTG